MNFMMKKFKSAFSCFFCFLSFSVFADDVVNESGGGGVNWTKGLIFANGYGVAPENTPVHKKKLLARRAAQVDGYRNLAELISGVRVSSETTVRNMESASDIVRTKISALVQGAVIKKEHYQNEIYTVRVEIDMNGPFFNAVKEGFLYSGKHQMSGVFPSSHFDSFGSGVRKVSALLMRQLLPASIIPTANADENATLPRLIHDTRELEFAKRVRDVFKSNNASYVENMLDEEISLLEGEFGFSGLLIDASGVSDFELATIPRIRNSEGDIIYPQDDLLTSENFARRPVSYDFSIADAIQNERVAINPYIVKAVGVYKSRKSDLVISKSDGTLIKDNFSLQDILSKAGVMIVVGQ